MKNTALIVITLFTITSCGSFQDAGKILRNEKIKTTDEFLVKKKDPLEMPPNYDLIPEPGSIKKSKESKKEIDQILNLPKNKKNSGETLSIERTILDRIKK